MISDLPFYNKATNKLSIALNSTSFELLIDIQ